MSHFITLVFNKENGKTVEQLLAPFDENNVYAAYVQYTKEQAIKEVRKEIDEYKNGLYAKYLENPKEYEENCHNKGHIEYLKNEFPKRLDWTDEECYEYMKKYYSEDMIRKMGIYYLHITQSRNGTGTALEADGINTLEPLTENKSTEPM